MCVWIEALPDWSVVRYAGRVGVFTRSGMDNQPTVFFDANNLEDHAVVPLDTSVELVAVPEETAFALIELKSY